MPAITENMRNVMRNIDAGRGADFEVTNQQALSRTLSALCKRGLVRINPKHGGYLLTAEGRALVEQGPPLTEEGKPYNNAIVTTAHSIRTLRICDECGGLGNVDSMLRIHRALRGSKEKDKVHVHGRCYIKLFGIRRLLSLPREETDHLTLGDIGMHAAKALLIKRESNS